MEDIVAYILAAFALVGSPGPATLSLAATGAAFGAGRGLGYLVGIEVGMILIMVITASGVTGLVMAQPKAVPFVAGLGAAYILFLAFRIATAPLSTQDSPPERHPSFLGGLFLSLVNPKAYASLAALFSGYVLVQDSLIEDALSKGIVLLVILTIVDVAWLVGGAVLVRRIRNPKTNRIVNVSFAALLIISVLFAIL